MDEVELQDLLIQALETNGCLSKIRAQLRASVFLALDENSEISKQQPLLNKKVKSCLESSEGQLLFSLVREFLDYFNLNFTLSVYDPETSFGNLYTCDKQEKVIEDLGIDNTEGPILLHLIKMLQKKSSPVKEKEMTNGIPAVPFTETLNSTFVIPNETTGIVQEQTSQSVIAEETILTNGNDASENPLDCTSKSETGTTVAAKQSDKSDKSKTKGSALEVPPFNKPPVSELLPSLYNKEFKDKSSLKDLDIHFYNELEYEDDFMTASETDASSQMVGYKIAGRSVSYDINSTEDENSQVKDTYVAKAGDTVCKSSESSISSGEENSHDYVAENTLRPNLGGET